MTTDDRITKLEQELRELRTQRITQDKIIPDAVKSRHIGEGVRFIRTGLEVDLPTQGETTSQGAAIYYAHDTKKLYIWNVVNKEWDEVTLS